MSIFKNKELYDMFKKMSQLEIIEYHLSKHKTITDTQARDLYGDRRLSDKILKLRKMGYEIVTHKVKGKNRFGKTTEYAVYELIKKPNAENIEH